KVDAPQRWRSRRFRKRKATRKLSYEDASPVLLKFEASARLAGVRAWSLARPLRVGAQSRSTKRLQSRRGTSMLLRAAASDPRLHPAAARCQGRHAHLPVVIR